MTTVFIDHEDNLWMKDGPLITKNADGSIEFSKSIMKEPYMVHVCGKIKQVRYLHEYGFFDAKKFHGAVLTKNNSLIYINTQSETFHDADSNIPADADDFVFGSDIVMYLHKCGALSISNDHRTAVDMDAKIVALLGHKEMDSIVVSYIDSQGRLFKDINKNSKQRFSSWEQMKPNFQHIKLQSPVLKVVKNWGIVILLENNQVLTKGIYFRRERETNTFPRSWTLRHENAIDISLTDNYMTVLDNKNKLFVAYRRDNRTFFEYPVETKHQLSEIIKLAPKDPMIMDLNQDIWCYDMTPTRSCTFDKIRGLPPIKSFADESLVNRRFSNTKRAI